MNPSPPPAELEVLIAADALARRVRELAVEISNDYRGRPVLLISILKGAWVFLADLIRHLELEVSVDFLGIASYANNSHPSGVVRITKDLDQSIEGLDVLVVEDILDTGLTFDYVRGVLEAHKPRSLKVVTLLDKPSRRLRPVEADYVGFTIPDLFVVGYGLDYAQQYRNLPGICILRLLP
jgi:hypoxanthine phosphoribosyltransferase